MKFELTYIEGRNIHDQIAESGIIDWIVKNTAFKKIAKTSEGKIMKGMVFVVNEASAKEIVEDAESALRTMKFLEE